VIRYRPMARPCGGGPGPPRRGRAGSLSLEAVLVLPVLALLVGGLLATVGIVRDVLMLHEGARVGVRAAATSTGTAPVRRAVQDAVPELPDVRVHVTPAQRTDGELVRVRVEVDRRLGPVTHRLRATAVARVEPVVGSPTGPVPP
jgi:Flp pilus assembly protein TadG